MLVSALISVAMVPIVASAQEVARPAAPQRVRFRDLYRNSPLGVVAVAISGMISSIIFSMGPVYARLIGPRHPRRGRLHGGQHPRRGTYAISGRTALRSHGPAHHDRDHVPGRNASWRRRSRSSARCRRIVFLVLAALFSGAALTLYSLSVSHVNDKLEPVADGRREQRAAAHQRHERGLRPGDHRRAHGRASARAPTLASSAASPGRLRSSTCGASSAGEPCRGPERTLHQHA